MHFGKRFVHSKSFFILLVLMFSVALSAVLSLSKSVENQSLLERKSLTPVFDFIHDEILKPLYIAETVARSSSLKEMINTGVADEQKLIGELQQLASEFGMVFFVASELAGKQYNSDGVVFALEPENVEWYFRAKDLPQHFFAALGKKEDVHIYFDIKMFNQQGDFTGFIGLGRSLQGFMQAFDKVKSRFDYEFVFVDQNGDIMLASDNALMADGSSIKNLRDLPWYQALSSKQENGQQLSDNNLVNLDGEDLLIAKANLKALNWQLFLVNSLDIRQTKSTTDFILQTLYIALALLFGLIIGRLFLRYIQGEFTSKHQNDPLTKLPNRAHLAWRFEQISHENQALAVIIVDIDHFKDINDTHGHAVGDAILCEFGDLLKSQLRSMDLVGRWGGEEFVMLLPETKLFSAFDVAERARKVIALHNFKVGKKTIYITASFGVAFVKQTNSLEDIIAQADTALYLAKASGRNAVRTSKDVELDRLANYAFEE